MNEFNESSVRICFLLNKAIELPVKFPSQVSMANFSVCIASVVLILPTIILNGLSIVTIFKCSQLKEKNSFFLKMMQSVPDLVVGLWSLPTLSVLMCSKARESAECLSLLLLNGSTALPTLISLATLFAMTVDRYFAVLHPLKHRTLITKRRILIFCCCAVSFMIPIYALSLLNAKLVGRFISIFLFIFLFVAVFVYTKIFLAVKSRQPPGDVHDLNNVREFESPAVRNRQIKRNILKQKRMAKSCFLVMVCFLVCFFGGIAMGLIYGLNIYEKYALQNWARVMVLFNSSLNSIIFFWTRPLLRNEAQKTLKNFRICK